MGRRCGGRASDVPASPVVSRLGPAGRSYLVDHTRVYTGYDTGIWYIVCGYQTVTTTPVVPLPSGRRLPDVRPSASLWRFPAVVVVSRETCGEDRYPPPMSYLGNCPAPPRLVLLHLPHVQLQRLPHFPQHRYPHTHRSLWGGDWGVRLGG
mgnify:CR=1 FL=1